MNQVQGFRAAALAAGIKYKDRPDLGLIVADAPAVAAGVFTTNRVKAAPVLLCRERLADGRAQAVLVNSGNANACTGEAGMTAARRCAALAARELGIDESLVLPASTGVIGQPLPEEPFARALPDLAKKLSPEGLHDVARAMMTTDLVEKTARRRIELGGKTVSLFGMAKGSGMIRPDMATMLCFLLTDAAVAPRALDQALHFAADASFNTITVDGDTSTNDTALILANGLAGNRPIDEDYPEGRALFTEALTDLCRELALMIVKDGEGATKLVHIRVTGARTRSEAESAARTIAESPLCKTAFFGADANWGRIIAALGRSNCGFRQDEVNIAFDDVLLVERGLYVGPAAEERAAAVLKRPEFTVTVTLREGPAEAVIHTCDFSYDYVKINADYRS